MTVIPRCSDRQGSNAVIVHGYNILLRSKFLGIKENFTTDR